ncbi:MAG: hypothetical protein WAM71_16835 [Candidatus Korobacteraceae bacterium]
MQAMTSPPHPRALEPSEVQQQIEKIVSSRTFVGKGQLIKLLKILAAHFDSTTLKPDRVIRELWPEETKTKTSADVATEMNRLRKALEGYYASEGGADTLLITLPNRAASTSGIREKHWMLAELRVPCRETAAEAELPRPPSRSGRRLWLLNTVLAAVLLLIAALFLGGLLSRDRRPHAGRIEGSTLIITNEKGDELWRKSFSDGFAPEYYEHGAAQRLWFGDLNGDGGSEVLLAYLPASGRLSNSSTLICYSSRGTEIWRWTPGRALPELEGDPPTFALESFSVLRDKASEPSRIVALSTHTPWYPSQLAILDSDGHLVSEYWHSGHLYNLTLADLDGDGRQEIILTGISNGYHQATMVVLDSDRVNGASVEAARPEIQIHGIGIPHERARLLFPRTDLNSATQPWNEALGSTAQNGKIRVWTEEYPHEDGIWYEFDNQFQLINAIAGDHFRSAHDEYFRKEKKSHLFGPEELKQFEKVRCLVGCPGEYVTLASR